MKVKINIPLYIVYLFSILFVCCNPSPSKQEAIASADSVKQTKADTVKIIPPAPVVHPVYNDLAKYIAGMQTPASSSIDSALHTSQWKEYAKKLDDSWKRLDSVKLEKMKTWRNEELKEVKPTTLFYPFSGADYLNADVFFPDADNYILVGLEPVGTLPHFKKDTHKDTIATYFNEVNQSLYAILNFSFFRTISMNKDFKNKDLNGTIHLIVLFMERTGNSIVDIKPAFVNEDGTISEKENNAGVEIDFINADNKLKHLYYFSVNLDNNHLNKNKAFVNLINKNKDCTTYIKSASYLMYEDYFSVIRDLIITNSKNVLQDDSGIPYKYFKTDVWNTHLYGVYTGAISLFKNVHQQDLEDEYKKKENVKPLNFGIGYKYKLGQSNLMLFKKKA